MAAPATTATTTSNTAVVQLCQEPLRFTPVDSTHQIFYDDANRQIFTVREGATEIQFSTVSDQSVNTLRLGRGAIVAMKFSPDQRILAVQRTQRTIVFVNNAPHLDPSEYSQGCKSKGSTHMLGFNWLTSTELVIVTNQGLEMYQVIPEKRSLKLLKTVAQPINWFLFSQEHEVLLLSTTPQANVLMPFHCKKGVMTKLARFEVDVPAAYNQLAQRLLERDVNIATIYGRKYAVIVQNNPPNADGPKAEIQLWILARDATVLEHILQLDMNGRFAINVVDNLVIAHHQVSKSSVLFDIRFRPLRTGHTDDRNTTHSAAVVLHDALVAPLPLAGGIADGPFESYAPSWIVFQPDIIIDAKLGALWNISVLHGPLAALLPSRVQSIDVLLRRRGCRALVLQTVRAALADDGSVTPLSMVAAIFDKINAVCLAAQFVAVNVTRLFTVKTTPSQALARQTPERFERENDNVVVDQSDLYSQVFAPLEDTAIKYKFFVAVLMEYIRSLNTMGLPVQHFLFEVVINQLVRNNRFYQLHQFLQYHVVNDSKHVACLLLSLEQAYPPAYQLALDMLKRVSTANDEIFDVLLSKKHLLAALRFARSLGPEAVATVSAASFLDLALQANDPALFFNVFKFFEQRNVAQRKSPLFTKADNCDIFVAHFFSLFPNTTSSTSSSSSAKSST